MYIHFRNLIGFFFFCLDDVHPFKESYRLFFCLDDVHPFKESYRLFCLDDVHLFKESYHLFFFIWTMYIRLRNLIVSFFVWMMYIHLRNLIVFIYLFLNLLGVFAFRWRFDNGQDNQNTLIVEWYVYSLRIIEKSLRHCWLLPIAVIPIRDISLDARHSMDKVACFHSDLPGGNFLGENSGRPCRVLPRLVLACLVLGPLLQESLFKRWDLQCWISST